MVTMLHVLVFAVTLSGCHGRGGTGNRQLEYDEEKRTYPHEKTGSYYHPYYMEYFTPSGFTYAANNIKSARTVSVCTNYDPVFKNGTYLGKFPCPMEKDPVEFDHCCGDTGYEYCCKALDARSVRIGIGFACAAGLGLTLGFIAFVVIKVKKSKLDAVTRDLSKKHMNKRGIPHYGTIKTKNYTAEQSIDGYQIVVTFKRQTFYQMFYEQLRMKYIDISWRYDDVHQVTEGKIAYSEDMWVNLLLSDEFEGHPIMIVMREKPSVDWMKTSFPEICSKVPDDGRLLCCCPGKNKTHPSMTDLVKDHPKDKHHAPNGQLHKEKMEKF